MGWMLLTTACRSKLGCRALVLHERDGHGKEADDIMGPLQAYCRTLEPREDADKRGPLVGVREEGGRVRGVWMIL